MEILFAVFSILVIIGIITNTTNAEKVERQNYLIREEKRKHAVGDGKSYFTVRWTSRGEIREDIATGVQYIEKKVHGHWCHFDARGRLIKDLTQEMLDRDLAGKCDVNLEDGKRLRMVDNRQYENLNGVTGLKYKDEINHRYYRVRIMENGLVVIQDFETLFIYDVLKRKGRSERNEADDIDFVKRFNWMVSQIPPNKRAERLNHKNKEYFEGRWRAMPELTPYDPEMDAADKVNPLDWQNHLVLQVREEFKDVVEFPLVTSKEDPNRERSLALTVSAGQKKSSVI